MWHLLRRGSAHTALVMTFLTLGAILATVMVAQSGTQFSDQAFEGQKTFVGEVSVVEPCVSSDLCYQLVNTQGGDRHYLLVRESWSNSVGVDLASFVGKRVQVFGQQVRRGNGEVFVLVQSVVLAVDFETKGLQN